MTWLLFITVVSCAEWFWSTSIYYMIICYKLTLTIFRLPSSLLHPPSPFFSFYFPLLLPLLMFSYLSTSSTSFFFSDPSSLALYFYLAGRCSRGWYCPHQQPVQWLPFSPTRGCGYWETWWGKLLHLSGQGQILALLFLHTWYYIVSHRSLFLLRHLPIHLHRHTDNTQTQAHTHDPTYSMPLLLQTELDFIWVWL